MHRQSKQDGEPTDAWVQKLVVLQVAGVRRGRERTRIHRALRDITPAVVDTAINSLEQAGVVIKRSTRQALCADSTSSE
jgi:DNA-binding HxlR family transcriptional regulator